MKGERTPVHPLLAAAPPVPLASAGGPPPLSGRPRPRGVKQRNSTPVTPVTPGNLIVPIRIAPCSVLVFMYFYLSLYEELEEERV